MVVMVVVMVMVMVMVMVVVPLCQHDGVECLCELLCASLARWRCRVRLWAIFGSERVRRALWRSGRLLFFLPALRAVGRHDGVVCLRRATPPLLLELPRATASPLHGLETDHPLRPGGTVAPGAGAKVLARTSGSSYP